MSEQRIQDPAEGDNDLHILIDRLDKVYDDGTNDPVHALSEINVSIDHGEFVSIVGPSGCGKTTLLKCIGNLVEPTNGNIYIDGVSPAEARRNRKSAYFFQEDVLLPWRTVLENVLLPLEIIGEDTSSSAVRSEAEAMIERVGLTGFENTYPNELSGGMRQRVALARGFIFDPEIYLMDEPFAALDELTRRDMNEFLLEIHQDMKKTTVFVTHHIAEAVWLSDTVIVLSARPGEVDTVVDIDLPRPRSHETRTSDAFHEYENRLTQRLFDTE